MEISPPHWLCHEGHLQLPQGYQDRTVNIFTSSASAAPVLNIARDQPGAGDTLTQWFDNQLALLAAQLPAWRQQARATVWLGAQHLAGEAVACDYLCHGTQIWQQQAVFNPAHAQLLVFTMTHAAPLRAADRRMFTALLRSFSFHPQPSASA